MKYASILLLFFLVCTIQVHAASGGITIEPYSPQQGPVDLTGADGTETFWDLPLWIQIGWIISVLAAALGVIKFGPLVFGKVKAILKNKNRIAILEYIEKNPGCTLADLSKNTGMNQGTIKYHLSILVLERNIIRQRNGKFGYLFANGGKHLEKKKVYGYVMNPTKHQILKSILNQPGISNKEIADMVQISRSTVHWHLQQFLEEKMVIARWDGKCMNYFVFPEVEDILTEYRR
jgi:predicted transcriptional regulator